LRSPFLEVAGVIDRQLAERARRRACDLRHRFSPSFSLLNLKLTASYKFK
jgi:hypothetical protein